MPEQETHTPGPWRVITTRRPAETVTGICDAGENEPSAGLAYINRLYDGISAPGTWQANARLISAAPDGYAAAIEARAEITRINEAAGETVFNPAATALLDAFIAKVNGHLTTNH